MITILRSINAVLNVTGKIEITSNFIRKTLMNIFDTHKCQNTATIRDK